MSYFLSLGCSVLKSQELNRIDMRLVALVELASFFSFLYCPRWGYGQYSINTKMVTHSEESLDTKRLFKECGREKDRLVQVPYLH